MYTPGPVLDETPGALHVGAWVNDEADSLFTKPLYDAVIVGGCAPVVIVVDSAVMVSGSAVTETVPVP